MYDEGKCIDFFFINQDIQFDKFTALIATEFIIKRSISSGTGFQCIKEIIDNLIQRELVFQKCTCLLPYIPFRYTDHGVPGRDP